MDAEFKVLSVLGAWTTGLAIFGVFLLAVSNAVLAWAAANDVERMYEGGRRTQFMGASGWAFVVLVTGLLGIAFYWVVHHSNLRDPASDRRL